MRIIIKDTIIEADANDLRQSNSLADAFASVLRNSFNGAIRTIPAEEDEDEDVEF